MLLPIFGENGKAGKAYFEDSAIPLVERSHMTPLLKNNALRKFGLNYVDDVPWGKHFCQFYETKKDLIDILVPYLSEGLRNNEFCMWITSPPFQMEEAKTALREAVPDLDKYIRKAQIELLPYTE